MHVKFEGVHGYATYAAAQKRGEEVERQRSGAAEFRWVVIALPNGRFAPMVVLNNNLPGGPGMFLGERNLCMTN
jgi:hypothetical protein